MPVSVNGLPVGPMTRAPVFEAAGGQRDIGGDDDVAFSRALGDPVVGRVRAVGDHHALDQRAVRQPHPAVGDEMHDQPVPLRHPHHLVLHGAGVGVDVEGDGHGFVMRVIVVTRLGLLVHALLQPFASEDIGMEHWSKAIASVAVCAATVAGAYVTGNANCLWGTFDRPSALQGLVNGDAAARSPLWRCPLPPRRDFTI